MGVLKCRGVIHNAKLSLNGRGDLWPVVTVAAAPQPRQRIKNSATVLADVVILLSRDDHPRIMVQYILDRYGKGQLQPPPGNPEHALYLQWSWFAEATFARPLGEIVNHSREFPDERRIDDVVAEMQSRAELSAKALGDEMSDKPFILGETFSAADIMLGYTVMLAERFLPEGLPDSLLPYWQRLSSRPAYQKAVS